MAITDTSPNETTLVPTTTSVGPTGSAVPNPRGVAGVLGTGDHLTIGRLYIGCSLLFGVAAFVLWAWFSLNATSATPDNFAISAFTLAQIGLVLLFAMPLFIGLATAIVPLQVGASTIAFPRAAAAAFWTWVLSGLLLCVSYLPAVGGGVGGAQAHGVQLTYLAIAAVVLSLLLATICVVTTVITLRTPGLTLDRVPVFAWSMVAAGGIWMITLSIFLVNVMLIFVDNRYNPTPGTYGVADAQWVQLSWLFTQPQVFAFAIPALGIIADAVATLAGARQPNRNMLLGAVGVFAALGFGAYAQPKFSPGIYHAWPFVAQCVLLILPLLALLGALAGVLRRGKPRVAGPVILSVVAVLMLALAALAAAIFGIGRLDLNNTAPQLATNLAIEQASTGSPIYTWGVFALVMVGAGAAGVAGVHYWGAKITGRSMPDGVGKLQGLIFLGAAVLSGAPLLVLGFVPRSDSLADSSSVMFTMVIAGSALAAVGCLLTFVTFIAARGAIVGGGEHASADPWESGQSLEWLCDSPPLPGNFGELALVTSAQPLLDIAETGGQA